MALFVRAKQIISFKERIIICIFTGFFLISLSILILLLSTTAAHTRIHYICSIGVFFSGSIISFQTGRFVVRYKILFGPGQEISKILKQVKCGDYCRRVSRFENELHFEHIAVTLNTMLDHIERFKKAVVHQASQLCKDNRILKEHNAELEDFLKIITHDLKSPLCTIEMLCDALMEQEAIKKSEYLDNVRILEENVAHLRKLVDDLLEYSLIGSHDENHQTVDVTALVGELFETFSPQVQQIGAKIYIAEPLPPLHGSYVQITHVFSNLITNALKYRSEKPLEISITGEKNNEYVHYTVRDNGSGIMPEICGKIFAVCFRGNVNAFPQGTGVGLSIVKKIVKNHGGRVWAESKGHNQGAAFHMLFPNGDRK